MFVDAVQSEKSSLFAKPDASGLNSVVNVAQLVNVVMSEFMNAAGTAIAAPCESAAPVAAVRSRFVAKALVVGKAAVLDAPTMPLAILNAP